MTAVEVARVPSHIKSGMSARRLVRPRLSKPHAGRDCHVHRRVHISSSARRAAESAMTIAPPVCVDRTEPECPDVAPESLGNLCGRAFVPSVGRRGELAASRHGRQLRNSEGSSFCPFAIPPVSALKHCYR